MILMMEAPEPDDYPVSTGECHTVREFVETAYKRISIDIIWKGEGVEERGYNKETGELLVTVDPRFYRPMECPYLHGDYSKTKNKLGWEPKTKFKELVTMMVDNDVDNYVEEKPSITSTYGRREV
jgi:GDPmannose 4,6-dehydratase